MKIGINAESRVEKKSPYLRIFGGIVLIVAIIELVFCFTGPFSFIRKPTLMLFPPFTSEMEDEKVEKVIGFLEREIALSNSYSIVFLLDYFRFH